MTWIIDAHQDLAYAAINFGRDYKRSVAASRAAEPTDPTNELTLGYPEYREAEVGLIFSTIFTERIRDAKREPRPGLQYRNGDEFHRAVMTQIDFYRRWHDDEDGKFQILKTRAELDAHCAAWDEPDRRDAAAVGLILLMEGAEGLRSFADLDEYMDAGLRLVGPVWGGGRFCGAAADDPRDGFTHEGIDLLHAMSGRHLILDVSHMNRKSAGQALERYEGVVVATHANAEALIQNPPNQRLLHDDTIRLLIERDGVIGVIPWNAFLNSSWKAGDDRRAVTLGTLVNHIDHICQIAGDAAHAALGTDFDGGFGFPQIPYELRHIGDLGKIQAVLSRRGYSQRDIDKILNGNWRRILKKGMINE